MIARFYGLTGGGVLQSPSALQWETSLYDHDPEPPLPLETAPFSQTEWPLPAPLGPPLDVTMSSRPQVDGVIAFNQDDWPLPRLPKPLTLVADPPNRLPLTGPIVPGESTDWVVPQRLFDRPTGWADSCARNLLTLSVVPGALFTWPLPVSSPSRPLVVDPPNLLLTTLAPSAATAPFRQTDWPVPPSAAARSLDHSFTTGRPLYYQDQQPFPSGDWPIPLRAIDQTFLVTTSTRPPVDPIVVGTPFNQTDWPIPLPARARPPVPDPLNYLTTVGFVAPVLPVGRQLDWPLPPAPPLQPPTLRQFIGYYVFDDTAPFTSSAGSVPAQPVYPVSLRTWTQNLLESTLAPPVVQPFSQTSWPIPDARPFQRFQPVGGRDLLRFQTDAVPPFFGSTDQANQHRPPVYPVVLRTFTQNLLQSTLEPPPVVGGSDDPIRLGTEPGSVVSSNPMLGGWVG